MGHHRHHAGKLGNGLPAPAGARGQRPNLGARSRRRLPSSAGTGSPGTRHGRSPTAEPSGPIPARWLHLSELDRLELARVTAWASSARSDIPQGNGSRAPARARGLNHQAGARPPAFTRRNWITRHWPRVSLGHHRHGRRFHPGQRIAGTGQSPKAEPSSPIPAACLHPPELDRLNSARPEPQG